MSSTSTGASVAEVAVAGRAIDVVVNPATNLVYALSETGVITILDGVSNRIASTISLGRAAMAIGINTITSRLYVGTIDGLVVVDGSALQVVATLPGVYASPDVIVNEATNRIYASSIAENRVTVLDGFTNAVVAVVDVGDRPAGLAVDFVSNRIYVANSGTPDQTGDTVTVIDGYRNVVAATIPVGRQDAIGVAVDSASGNLTVTMSNGPAVLIDGTSGEPLATSAESATVGVQAAPRAAAMTSQEPAPGPVWNATPATSLPGASIYNVRVATDATPDLTDLQSLISSTTSLWTTPREKVWALFYWSHILKRQTGPVVLHGFEVTDPIKNFSDYGFTMCSTVTGINQSLYEAIGLRHQYWDICTHTVSAVEYDGKFHMIDSSMSNLVTTDDGVTLASVEEAAADSARLVRERSLYATSAKGFLTGSDTIRSLPDMVNPVDGTLSNGFYRAFCAANLKYRDYYYNWSNGHRYVLNLRDGESYTRYFKPLNTTAGYWVSSEKVASPNPAQTFENDASNQFGLRGNGKWSFSPSLSAGAWTGSVYRSSNIAPAATGGLRPDTAGVTSELVYKVQAANAITSQHIEAQFARADALATAAIAVSVNHGATWTSVGTIDASVGIVPVTIDLRDEVNSAYETLIRIQMASDSANPEGISLVQLSIETITQVNAKALPKLNIGRNEIYIAAGDQSDTMVLWPDLRGDLWKKDVYDSTNIVSQPIPMPRIYTAVAYPAVFTQDAYLTYRLDAPTDITRVVYGGRLFNPTAGSYIDFLHSFDGGATWTRSYRLSDVSKPYDVIHYETVTGIPAGVRTVLFKYLIHATGTTTTKVSGLYAARMEVNHRSVTEAPAPLDVTFRWLEVKANRTTVARSHQQHVTEFPFTYIIDVGGVDHPIMDSVTVNVAAAGGGAPSGYNDGVDAGGTKYLYKKRTDGTNLAVHKPYTISRAPSGFQSSAPATNTTILTDGVVGAPATGGLAYWMGQCWTSGQPVDLQVDLGVPRAVSVMRAHLLGYPGWDAFKGQVLDTVEVLTSTDGLTFASQGFLQTSLWRKDVPINYLVQDDERATAWNFELALPVAAVARYVRYHVTPKRNLCSSELQVFDHVDDTPFDIRIAPPAGMGGSPANVPPSVALTSPGADTEFVAPASVQLSANANDSDGTIQQVDFFAGSTLVGTATASPFAVTWADAAAGSYTLTARALDNSGGMTTSAPVHITVTAAENVVTVPDVTGTPQATAASTLAAAGLAVGAVTNATSGTVPAGTVISQAPGGGTTAAVGSSVALLVSTGVGSILVPNVVGQTQAAAMSALTLAGLTTQSVTPASSDTVASGKVISQSPPAGVAVVPGSGIALVVSSGPAAPNLPSPWLTQDIGAVGRTGTASYAAATQTFSVVGAGADVWGTADALRYVYRPFDGDGEIVARVASVQNTNAWVKAGVMVRENLTAGSAQAMMMVTPSKGNNFQRRLVTGGATTGTAGAVVTAPYWVKLSRRGAIITASQSADGVTWSTVGTATMTLPSSIFVGLGVSSHSTTTLATATFDNVTVTGAPGGTQVPDVSGFTQSAAAAALTSAGLTVGTISSTSSDTVPVDCVVSESPVAGTTVAPGTAVALVISTGSAMVAVPDVTGLTQSAATTVIAAAGLTVGTVTSANSTTVPAGIVISENPAGGSSVVSGSAVALVVSVGPPASVLPSPWTSKDVGVVGKTGNATFDPASSTFSVTGAGADIWGSSDAFRYVYQALAGDGQIVARVASVQNTNVWVKAGVMFRADLTSGSAQAMMMVTPGKGNNFQRRATTGGATTGTAGAVVKAPYWVKLTRSGSLISAYQSADGATWSLVGTATINLPATALVGLAVSSHSTSTLATATFDQVSIGPIN